MMAHSFLMSWRRRIIDIILDSIPSGSISCWANVAVYGCCHDEEPSSWGTMELFPAGVTKQTSSPKHIHLRLVIEGFDEQRPVRSSRMQLL